MSKTFKEEFELVRERDAATRELLSETYRDEEERLHGGLYDPAIVKYAAGEKPYHFEYWHHGLEHRLDGPSVITINPETDVVIYERYCQLGEKHRDKREGHAIVERDPKTGTVINAEYHEVEAMLHWGDINSEPS